MKLFAGAVILFLLVGAPTFARQQQDEKAQQQDKKAKPQERQPREQQPKERQPQEQPRTRTRQEQSQQRTAPKEQQRAAQQEERSRAKEQQSQQRTAQKEQQSQRQETSKQEQSRAKQEQQQSRQQAKVRQQQQRNNSRQQQQYAREQRPQARNNGQGMATRTNYHANDIHPRHGGRVIADQAYDAHFGSDHHFHAHWRHDADRFQYGGYWFTYAEPWPVMWTDSDDLYIVYNYDDDDYYLCDADHPGVELLIVVES